MERVYLVVGWELLFINSWDLSSFNIAWICNMDGGCGAPQRRPGCCCSVAVVYYARYARISRDPEYQNIYTKIIWQINQNTFAAEHTCTGLVVPAVALARVYPKAMSNVKSLAATRVCIPQLFVSIRRYVTVWISRLIYWFWRACLCVPRSVRM